MRPLKASILFVYCLAALAAVGTAVSHLWTTTQLYRNDSLRLGASVPVAPATAPAQSPVSAPPAAQPS